MLKNNSISTIVENIKNTLQAQEYKDILQFAVEDVDLSGDVSAPKSRVDLDNAPHLIEPLQASILSAGRKEIAFCAPEQCGKSLLLNISLLHSCCYNRLQCLVLYPSLELAVETARTKFLPLFRGIKKFKNDLENPFAIRSDRMLLPNACIYWQGAGSPVVSRSVKAIYLDEVAVWEHPPRINNVLEAKKRTRSYDDCLIFLCSTPKYKDDPFWREWLLGSQGVFTLQCQQCGKHTIPSSDVHNLQFNTEYSEELQQYVVIPGSERLICPDCHYEHSEEFREKMIKNGKYIHLFPSRLQHFPSFRCGVLASLLPVHSWGEVANQQLSAGRSSTLEEQISFDNSIRGLPYQERKRSVDSEITLKHHYYSSEELPVDDIVCTFLTADTQDAFSVVGVFAMTKQKNIYLLDIQRPRFLFLKEDEKKIIDTENRQNEKPPEVTVLDMLNREYHGFKPLALLVDMRGHRTEEIKNFSKKQRNILLYAGTSLKFEKWQISKNNAKIFLCDARKYQAELIFNLYFSKNKKSNYLYLPDNISEKDIAEIIEIQPDKTKRNGHNYENWEASGVHDGFDILKMAFCFKDIAEKIYKKHLANLDDLSKKNKVKK